MYECRPKYGRAARISKDDIAARFHMSIDCAALDLGVGVTTLKKLSRAHGISRWPFRKVQQLVRIGKMSQAGLVSVRDFQYLLRLLVELDLWLDSPLWAQVDADAAKGIRSTLLQCGEAVQHGRDSGGRVPASILPPFVVVGPLDSLVNAAEQQTSLPAMVPVGSPHDPVGSPQEEQDSPAIADPASFNTAEHSSNTAGSAGEGGTCRSGAVSSSASVSALTQIMLEEVWALMSAAAEKLLPPSLGGMRPPPASASALLQSLRPWAHCASGTGSLWRRSPQPLRAAQDSAPRDSVPVHNSSSSNGVAGTGTTDALAFVQRAAHARASASSLQGINTARLLGMLYSSSQASAAGAPAAMPPPQPTQQKQQQLSLAQQQTNSATAINSDEGTSNCIRVALRMLSELQARVSAASPPLLPTLNHQRLPAHPDHGGRGIEEALSQLLCLLTRSQE